MVQRKLRRHIYWFRNQSHRNTHNLDHIFCTRRRHMQYNCMRKQGIEAEHLLYSPIRNHCFSRFCLCRYECHIYGQWRKPWKQCKLEVVPEQLQRYRYQYWKQSDRYAFCQRNLFRQNRGHLQQYNLHRPTSENQYLLGCTYRYHIQC
jgi:hypothetical protein